MRRAVLLGVPGSRRANYLMQAAGQAGLPLGFWDWEDKGKDIGYVAEDGLLIKIDPPRWDSCALGELKRLSGDYKKQLGRLARAAGTYDIRFFNHPLAIAALLDKAGCKETLRRAGLPVTRLLAKAAPGGSVENTEQLLEMMREENISQVFIKPVDGSGAAGVSAFRRQPGSGRMALYTCAMERPGEGLVHTRRLRRFTDACKIFSLLDRILQMECVIEQWYAKAEHQGYSYDLRAVVQDGRVDFLLARLSKGPVTNLQLNNHPLAVKELGLPPSVLDAVWDVSLRSLAPYPGLSCAGVDILLEKGSLKPRIIEMNGQGDLIYQDIYGENIIYRRQAEIMKTMRGQET